MVEQEVLSELVAIRWLLIGLTAMFVVILAASVVFATSMMSLVRTRVAGDTRVRFSSEVERLEDLGDYTKMVEECEYRLQEYPADVWARFKLAVGNHKAGNPGKALEALARVKQIDPAWERKLVDDYLDEIRDSMQGPTT